MIRNWRAAVVTLGAAAAGVLAFAAPAAADVAVTPSEAPKGGAAELAFSVPEERTGAYTTKVELVAPEATPIAEIYPMSVDGWAPMITTRKLDQPIELIHGTRTTEVPASIIWTRVGDAPAGPAEPTALTVSLGPMPQSDRVTFTLVQTYSDGTVVRWTDQPADGAQAKNPAPAVTLVDQAPGGDPQGADGHGADGHGASGHSAADAAAADAVPAAHTDTAGGNGTYGILGAGLVVGLAAGLGLDGWIILRAVRRNSAGSSSGATAASAPTGSN
jgi:uncharacterized protein YcnI